MTRECVNCGELREVHCTEEQYRRWQSGVLIQNAMPDLPAEERELLISGICGECFKYIFLGD